MDLVQPINSEMRNVIFQLGYILQIVLGLGLVVFTHYNRFLRKMLSFKKTESRFVSKSPFSLIEKLRFSSHYLWAGLSPFKSQHPFYISLRFPRTFGFD